MTSALRRARGGILCVVLVALWAHAQPAPEPATAIVPREPVHGARFMVAAAHPLAVRAGYDTIKAGGNALDAAIAVQLVLGLVEPQSSGIGGGGFLLYYAAGTGAVHAFDGRETAPAAAEPGRFMTGPGRFLSWPQAAIGGRAVGVPGLLRMLELAHRRHGRLPWARLAEPAIRLAQAGFAVTPRLHALLAADRFLPLDDNARRYFYRPDGSARPVGTLLRNPEYAEVLERVALEGAGAFYQGGIARDIALAVRSNRRSPGDLTEADLARYEAKERQPLCGPFRRWRVCGMPPPSSGGIAVLQMLGLLERVDIRAMRPGSLEAVHAFSEAGRLAYADRDAYIADPDFVAAPLVGLLEARYLDARARLIDPARSLGRARPGVPAGAPQFAPAPAAEAESTTHLSIVDGDGNAVALTSSLESAFGNRQMVRGFLLNNELTDFSWLPEQAGRPVANRVEPGKRPRSSMAPTLVFDEQGRLLLIMGSPGGHWIINYVAKTLVAVLEWQMGIQPAVASPNFGSRNGPTELEQGTALAALAPRLRELGHTVQIGPHTSGLHGIVRSPAGWTAGIDPRREGTAMGD